MPSPNETDPQSVQPLALYSLMNIKSGADISVNSRVRS
jgi:hypothetical protein